MSSNPILTQLDALALCRACAYAVYDTRAPSARYAENVARQLYGTGAHESGGWAHSRQIGVSGASMRGAFGLWQTEAGTVQDSIDLLLRKPGLAARCAVYLFGAGAEAETWLSRVMIDVNYPRALLSALCDWPKLSCLFARLHYLRDPSAIPSGVNDQALYYKRVYNTYQGGATPSDFAAAMTRYWPEREPATSPRDPDVRRSSLGGG